MLQTERSASIEDALRAALGGNQAGLWTALPAIIQSFDANALTCSAQPAIQAQVRAQDGSTSWVTLPLLVDVPVCFPRGGGCTLTFPVAAGDEALIVFSSRCIDAWWQSGGVQVQAELRMHDLSDGFAILGPFSQATKISGVSTSAVQLRSNDGQAYLQLNPSSHEIDIVTPGNWAANVGGNTTINVTGNASVSAKNVAVTATQSASVTAPSISLGAASQSLLSFVTSAFMSLFNGHTHASSGAGIPNQQMTSAHLTTTIKGG